MDFKKDKTPKEENPAGKQSNFIREIIDEDLKTNKYNGGVHTRFPPEPNGYLHIGHAKSISLNFGIARDYKGLCNLRFDDTNPTKEEQEYVDSIKEDIRWLGFHWEEREFFASDYFDQLFEYAVILIKKGVAYIDSSTSDEIRDHRGTPTQPGKKSPYFFSAPDQYDEKVIQKRWKEDSVDLLKKLSERIKPLSHPTKEDYEIALNDIASESGAGIGKIIHPLRLAVSGMGEGPGVFDILFVIGKEENLRRINTAIQKIKIN